MEDINNDDKNLSTIDALRRQEDDVSICINFINLSTNNEITETCRTSMVVYLQKIGKALKLSPETVWIAISFFDRYLSSGKGKSNDALQDKYKFQLVAISSFYIAVKLYEQVELSVDTLAKLCKGYYAKEDILQSEEDILFALDFRLTTPTPMEFIRHYIHLLPSDIIDNKLLKECEKRVEYTSTDIYFTFCKPSCVGASILTSILLDQNVMSSTERQTLYLKLAKMTDLIEVMECQKKLATGMAVSIPHVSSVKKSISSKVATTPVVAIASDESSPVSVEKTPRAA